LKQGNRPIGGLGSSVQRIILERRHLVLAVGELGEIPSQIVLITFRSVERILPRRKPIHVVIGVRRRLVLRIGDGQAQRIERQYCWSRRNLGAIGADREGVAWRAREFDLDLIGARIDCGGRG